VGTQGTNLNLQVKHIKARSLINAEQNSILNTWLRTEERNAERERDSKSLSTFSPPIENPDARKEADLSERGSCNSASW